jgi:hypothetical protein
MNQLFNLLNGEINDADEVFDKKNLGKNDWRRVLYNYYVLKDPQVIEMLEKAGMHKLETVDVLDADKNPVLDKEGKQLKKKKLTSNPLQVIPDRFEQIRNYVVLHMNDFPNQTPNEVATHMINDHLFDSEDDFRKHISDPVKKMSNILGGIDVSQNFRCLRNIWQSWKSINQMNEHEFNQYIEMMQATKKGSNERCIDSIVNLHDRDGKYNGLGNKPEEAIKTVKWLNGDLDCNRILQLLSTAMHKLGFGNYEDFYKIVMSKPLQDIAWDNGKCIFTPEYYMSDNPLERSAKWKKANNLLRLYISTYINELNINKVMITNSVFQGELGYDNTNGLIGNKVTEKEERNELIHKNWLNGTKRDKNIKVAKTMNVNYTPKFVFPKQDWKVWKIGDIEYQDDHKKEQCLQNEIHKFVSENQIEYDKVFDDVCQTILDKGNRLPFEINAERDQFNQLEAIEKDEYLRDLILQNHVIQLNEWSVDLRQYTAREFDQPLKPKRISKDEWQKLPMEVKAEYYAEHRNYYSGLDTNLNEFSLDDELLAVDILLLHNDDKNRRNDKRKIIEKDYYKQANPEVKRYLRLYGNIQDPNVSNKYLPDAPDKIDPNRYLKWNAKNEDQAIGNGDWHQRHPQYRQWRISNGLTTFPEEVCRRKFLQNLQDPNKMFIPSPDTIHSYVKHTTELKEKIKNKVFHDEIPEYEEYMSLNSKNYVFNPVLRGDNRTNWILRHTKKKQTIPTAYNDTPEDTAYDQAIEDYLKFIMKSNSRAKGVLNNIKNLCCLSMKDMNKLHKKLSTNVNSDLNFYYTLGEKYNNKINERMSDYGLAVATLKDMAQKCPTLLDARTKAWINQLDENKLSRVVSSNINWILQNRKDNDLINLTDILHHELDCCNITSDKPYLHKIDTYSLFTKPVGQTLEVEYDEDLMEFVNPLYDKDPKWEDDHPTRWQRFKGWFKRNPKPEHRKGTDLITITKNDDHELSFTSKETGLTYTILKEKPKVKRLIKIDNELIPKGETKINEYENGILGDFTTTTYRLNELEITKKKKEPEPKRKEEPNQNRSMEIATYPINVNQEDAWEQSDYQMKQATNNKATLDIPPNLSQHENALKPI